MTDAIAPLLSMTDIIKRFPGVLALDGASLSVLPGEVHALVGQNGAGKSTMMKILNGAYPKDEGSIRVGGSEVNFTTPAAAQQGGISTIYQEINLVPFRSVAENIFLGREPRRLGLVNWGKVNREAEEILGRLGIHVDVRRPLGEYNVALQQMVAIARAVSFDSRLVIMDEPTSSLDDRETEMLFDVIRQLQSNGVAVIFITHRLDELFAVCDRVTVMRDGRTVDVRDMASITRLELVSLMLGRDLNEVRREGATGFAVRNASSTERPLMAASHLSHGRTLRDASLDVRPGEIVGLTGLLGSGRTEVARALFGADALEGGTVNFKGRDVRYKSPRDAIRDGIGFCSEDRKADGIIPYMSVRENLTLAAMPKLSRRGIVDTEKQQEIVDRYIERLGIKTAGPDQRIRDLSGGNQQKVLLARWLCMQPDFLILDEPTRGIDVGAKAEIQRLIDELADAGLGVLMISSELEEITEGSDRVVVMRDGKTVAAFDRDEISQDGIMAAIANGNADSIVVARPVEGEASA